MKRSIVNKYTSLVTHLFLQSVRTTTTTDAFIHYDNTLPFPVRNRKLTRKTAYTHRPKPPNGYHHPTGTAASRNLHPENNDDLESSLPPPFIFDPRSPESNPSSTSPNNSNRRRRRHLSRSERERQLRKYYFTGDDLHESRTLVRTLEGELRRATRRRDEVAEGTIRRRMVSLMRRDPEFVYARSMTALRDAKRKLVDDNGDGGGGVVEEEEKDEEKRVLEELKIVARDARGCLPQFNLEGLWVGRCGNDSHLEMINITYAGDALVAYKVAGNNDIPRGEVIFTSDLSSSLYNHKKSSSSTTNDALVPIPLSESASAKWGVKHLTRFPGMGHVLSSAAPPPAEESFGTTFGKTPRQRQWVPGQLLLVGDYISFAWLPLERQVFFGRPTPGMVLSMMKDVVVRRDGDGEGVGAMRAHIMRCYEETMNLEEDSAVEGLVVGDHSYASEGCYE